MDEGIRRALYRRAVGFEADEVTEEYSFNEGEEGLLKRRVVKKQVPPDVAAAKLYVEAQKPLTELTDEELEREKDRLLHLLKSVEEDNGEKRERRG